MFFYLFAACLLVSIGVLVYMASKNFNNIDIHFWSIVVIIPIILLGYTLKAGAQGVDDAKTAMCFIYLDSTVLLMLVLTSMLHMLGIKIPAWINMLAYAICFGHLGSIWLCKNNSLYYSSFAIEKTAMGTITKMTDGPLKVTHYIYLLVLLLLVIGTLIGCFLLKKDSSKKAMSIYAAVFVMGIFCYFVETVTDVDFSYLPFLYVIGDLIIAILYERIHSHDIDSVVGSNKKEMARRGYAAFSLKKELLCYNDYASFYVPEIAGKRIDDRFSDSDENLINIFYSVIEDFEKNKTASAVFPHDDIFFKCEVTYFYMHEGAKPSGYLVEIQDVTAEQGYMNLIKEYGQSLEKEVEDKTSHIRYIQQKIVLGMATIIENRDMNTGGHVNRTSDIIKILVEEMKRQNVGDLDDDFADEIVKAAPMHDLGKISVDNAILNKPGKLTDDEYKIMKTHSAKSGEIVESILAGVEEPHFVQTAYQLARFHHERWDGKGYPERLAQYEIPIEARIMAVADVYDALVSKRSYKEAMSFEKASEIMLEGMGTQFDPMMGPIFEGCRDQLEDYYRNLAGV